MKKLKRRQDKKNELVITTLKKKKLKTKDKTKIAVENERKEFVEEILSET